MFYARKVSLAKWDSKKKGLEAEEIPADALTADLRTQDDALSFWKCRSDRKEHCSQVALAIVAAGERINKVDLALIPEEVLADHFGSSIQDIRGDTPYKDFAEQHCSLNGLDSTRLVQVANLIADAIKKKGAATRSTKTELTEMINSENEQGRIATEKLLPKLRESLKKP